MGALRTMAGVVAVGAKRLDERGRVFSMGEFVVHPKGFHHLGKGVLAEAYRFPEEVDAVAGGVMAIDEAALCEVGGVDVLEGGLGLIDACLRMRANGGRVVVVPQVVVVDGQGVVADEAEAEAFERRWGFSWRAADLDAVRDQHGGTGLLWNVRYWSESMPFEKYRKRSAVHWENYRNVDVYRQRADQLAGLAAQSWGGGGVLDLGCGDGLFSHLFALRGARVTGVDLEREAIEQAGSQTAEVNYPGSRPAFLLGTPGGLAFDDASFDLVVMLDVIEHLPNPVGVLREVARVVRPGGRLLVTTPSWQFGGWSDPVYHVSEYSPEELRRQVEAATGMTTCNVGKVGGVYRDLILIVRKGGGRSPFTG